MRLDEILNKFEGIKQLNEKSYQVRCPAHRR